MALPTIVAVGTVSAVTGGACVPGLPAGWAAGDIQLLFIEAANEPLNTVAGYTRIGSGAVIQATGLITDLSAFYRRAVGGDTAPSITSTPQNHLIARIIGVRGAVTTGSPINVVATGVDNTTGTAFSIPGATTSAVDCLVFAALSTGTDITSTARVSGWTNASLGTLTERIDNWTANGNGGGIAVASGTRAASGAYSATTGTLVAATNQTKAFMSFAVQGISATNATPTPSAVATVAAVPAPSFSTGSRTAPAVVVTVSAVGSPTVQTGTRVTAAAVATMAGIPAPSVASGTNATPTPAAVATVAAVPAPSLSTGQRVTATAVATASTLPAAGLSTGSRVSPAAVATVAAVGAVAVTTGTRVTAVAVATVSAVGSPTVSAPIVVVAAVVSTVSTLPAPSLRTGSTVTAQAIATFTEVGAATVVTPSMRYTFRIATGGTVRPPGSLVYRSVGV